jgi:hypothetical protein
MRHQLSGIAAAVLVTVTLVACQGIVQSSSTPKDTLVASKVGTAPKPEALASDPVWNQARQINVQLTGGKNLTGGETAATLKAVYTGDMLYMLLQYKDPTNSIRRVPFQKQADGSWIQVRDPNDKGGDNNLVYEDKWAMIWPINNSVKGFAEQGCAVLCHEGEGKPYGNKYSRQEGELADMWHAKGMRTGPLGYLDDQYVDHTRHSQQTPNAGRKGDPGPQGGEYTALRLQNGKPPLMNRDAKPANAGGNYFIAKGNEVTFVDNFKPGDELAAHISNPIAGFDRGDVAVAQKWENGVITAVLSRKLKTGSKFDVQFDPASRYPFGVAVFDNAQVRHATPDDPLFMVFGK